MRLTRRLHLGLLLLSSFCVLWLGSMAHAAEEETPLAETGTPFGVRSAYLQLVDGVYLLSARLHVHIDDNLRAVLKDGVAVQMGLEIKVIRKRGYWMDEEVAALTQQYQLRYHAVSDRYIVRVLNGGEQLSFPTLDDAFASITHIEGLPLLDQTLIRKDREYDAQLRATLDIGDVPAALRWLMFWADDGHRVSEWYSWRVPN